MANLGETFVAGDMPESRSYDIIPAGWYDATITKADVNPTKNGTGQKIDIRYDITGPTQQGRVMFGSVNIRNQSVKAEEIGRQQLADIMRAIGLERITDSDQLIGAPICIKVKIKEPSEQDKAAGYTEARNEIGGWKTVGGGGVRAADIPTFAKPAPAAAPATAAPPWAKR
jgi:hypothetical protein